MVNIETREMERHGAGLRRLLPPHERLLTMTGFDRAEGKSWLESPPDTRSPGRKAVERTATVTLGPLLYLAFGSPPSLARIFGGVSESGHAGSWAFWLDDTWRRMVLKERRSGALMVTDRRLLLASWKIWGKDPDYAIALEIPREAVAQAAVVPRPFTRGRVELRFTDGSMMALKFAKYRTGPAWSFVQSLTGPNAASTATSPPPESY